MILDLITNQSVIENIFHRMDSTPQMFIAANRSLKTNPDIELGISRESVEGDIELIICERYHLKYLFGYICEHKLFKCGWSRLPMPYLLNATLQNPKLLKKYLLNNEFLEHDSSTLFEEYYPILEENQFRIKIDKISFKRYDLDNQIIIRSRRIYVRGKRYSVKHRIQLFLGSSLDKFIYHDFIQFDDVITTSFAYTDKEYLFRKNTTRKSEAYALIIAAIAHFELFKKPEPEIPYIPRILFERYPEAIYRSIEYMIDIDYGLINRNFINAIFYVGADMTLCLTTMIRYVAYSDELDKYRIMDKIEVIRHLVDLGADPTQIISRWIRHMKKARVLKLEFFDNN